MKQSSHKSESDVQHTKVDIKPMHVIPKWSGKKVAPGSRRWFVGPKPAIERRDPAGRSGPPHRSPALGARLCRTPLHTAKWRVHSGSPLWLVGEPDDQSIPFAYLYVIPVNDSFRCFHGGGIVGVIVQKFGPYVAAVDADDVGVIVRHSVAPLNRREHMNSQSPTDAEVWGGDISQWHNCQLGSHERRGPEQ